MFVSKKIVRFTLLNLAVCLLCFNVVAQDWAPLGAKWWFTTEWCPEDPDCGYYTIESIKDTNITGMDAKLLRVEGKGDSSLYLPSEFIMYGDSDRVYLYDTINGEFFTLYDFSLNAGDTLTVQDTVYRGYFESANEDSVALFQVIIDSAKTQVINGQNLRTLYTSPVELSEYLFIKPIIEKIGCIKTMFGEGRDKPSIGWYGGLRCYQDSTQFYETGIADSCNAIYVNVFEQTKERHPFYIYPNPAQDYLNIASKTTTFREFDVKIYHYTGTVVYSGTFKNEKLIQPDISNWKPGIYFVQIRNEISSSVKKVVVYE